MKKFILAIACLFLGYESPLHAQDSGKREILSQEIQKELNLTDDQLEAFKTIRKDAHDKRKANKTTYAADKRALHQANMKLQAETEAKLKAILSDPQFKKLQAIQHERHKEKVLKKAEEAATALSLNTAQRSQFFALVAETDNKLAANRKTLSRDPEALKKANRAVRQATKEQLKKIFTPEQMTALTAFMKNKEGNKGTK